MPVFRDTGHCSHTFLQVSIHEPLWLPPAVKAETRRRSLGREKYQHFYRPRSSSKLKTACLVLWEPTQCVRASDRLRKAQDEGSDTIPPPLTGTLSAPELARHGTITAFSLRSGTACYSVPHTHHLRSFLKHCVPGTCHQWSVSDVSHACALSGTTAVDT